MTGEPGRPADALLRWLRELSELDVDTAEERLLEAFDGDEGAVIRFLSRLGGKPES